MPTPVTPSPDDHLPEKRRAKRRLVCFEDAGEGQVEVPLSRVVRAVLAGQAEIGDFTVTVKPAVTDNWTKLPTGLLKASGPPSAFAVHEPTPSTSNVVSNLHMDARSEQRP
jgi:hypothetical protein